MAITVGKSKENGTRVCRIFEYSSRCMSGTKRMQVWYNEGEENLVYKRLLQKHISLRPKGGQVYLYNDDSEFLSKAGKTIEDWKREKGDNRTPIQKALDARLDEYLKLHGVKR